MSRKPYWMCFSIIWIVVAISVRMWLVSGVDLTTLESLDPTAFLSSNPLFPLLFFVLKWIELSLVIKRLQDMGLTGFLALLIFLPLIDFLMVIFLGFAPGEDKPNKHGPLPNSYWRKR